MAVSIAVVILLLIGAFYYFRKMEQEFGDEFDFVFVSFRVIGDRFFASVKTIHELHATTLQVDGRPWKQCLT